MMTSCISKVSQSFWSPAVLSFLVGLLAISLPAQAEDERQLLWGDTHVHTSYSVDAYLFGNRTVDPDTAYRFAKGLPVINPGNGARVKLAEPLDFMVVSDHAEALNVLQRLEQDDATLLATKFAKQYSDTVRDGEGIAAYRDLTRSIREEEPQDIFTELQSEAVLAPAWKDTIEAADRHNEPGIFTALIGWEWTASPGAANLHRVVMTDTDARKAIDFLPFSALDSQKPEDLWAFLERTSDRLDIRFVAIPHNSNLSQGRMFSLEDSAGNPLSADYAQTRMRWEPVVEVTQVKGDSETHPTLSPTDEFADFETYKFLISGGGKDTGTEAPEGNYIRSALRRGMEVEAQTGTNPYQFGLIGSTDTHIGLSSVDENDFQGKLAFQSTPQERWERKQTHGNTRPTGWDMGAQGRAAVWAEENTREAIIDAFQRREVYATTGPRILLRVYAGPALSADMLTQADWPTAAAQHGVPMGGEMTESPETPLLLIQAARDPRSGALDRIQVVKGWVDNNGMTHERVFDVAASNGRQPDEEGNTLPPVPSTVNHETATYTDEYGADELTAAWRDPTFDPAQRAFYYVRVLEVPTPRAPLYDQVALQKKLPESVTLELQERAYSSPIWYTPLEP